MAFNVYNNAYYRLFIYKYYPIKIDLQFDFEVQCNVNWYVVGEWIAMQ